MLQNKNQEPEEDPLAKLKSQKLVSCRICKGDHWTTKCPYKDTLAPIQVNHIHHNLYKTIGLVQKFNSFSNDIVPRKKCIDYIEKLP